MKQTIFTKVLGITAAVAMLFATVSISAAAEQGFKRYGVKLGGIYIMPDEKFDSALSGLRPTVDDAATPALSLEYFFTKNVSSELVLALAKHDIMIDDGGVNAGSLWLLPPSLYIKYHPIPQYKVSPYVGFGMNVVMPFDEKIVLGTLDVGTSVGWAAKVGADIKITDSVFLNIDAMYYDSRPDMRINGTKFKLNINPFIIGTNIGLRF